MVFTGFLPGRADRLHCPFLCSFLISDNGLTQGFLVPAAPASLRAVFWTRGLSAQQMGCLGGRIPKGSFYGHFPSLFRCFLIFQFLAFFPPFTVQGTSIFDFLRAFRFPR